MTNARILAIKSATVPASSATHSDFMAPPNSAFAQVSNNEWTLSKQIAASRRRQLQNPPSYEKLVEGLMHPMSLVKVAREESRDAPGYFRTVVVIKVQASSLDLFYNSASGYRAQYYEAPMLGIAANRFAIDRLLPAIATKVAEANKRTCPPAWVEASLRHPDAKLWPHQGLWIRYAKKADRNLLVARWLVQLTASDATRRKRAQCSMLTPAAEQLLELKGGFLSLSGSSLETLKPRRAQDLHELGFT